MTEKERLIDMAKRWEAVSIIYDVYYPTEKNNELVYSSLSWHGYDVRFSFDNNGNVIEAAAGC